MKKKKVWVPGFNFKVFLHRAENMPSVQSLVATSSRPNIWAAVIDFGFILISLFEFKTKDTVKKNWKTFTNNARHENQVPAGFRIERL